MWMLRLLRRLTGYVRLEIQGDRAERLLNLCARSGITVWDISRPRHGAVRLCVDRRNLAKVREYAGRTGCILQLAGEQGILHDLQQHRRRIAFFVCALAFVLLVYLSSTVVWEIQLDGNFSVGQEEMLHYLEEQGLYVGARLMSVDTENLEWLIRRDHPEIIHCGITRQGTRVTVFLQDALEYTPHVPLDEPCHLIAERDGQILEMQVREGEKMVMTGQAVLKGQMLANGVMEGGEEGYRLVHSFGQVFAETYYEIQETVALHQSDWVRTGRSKTAWDVSFFGLSLDLSKICSIPYEKYDKMSQTDNVMVGGKTLPIACRTVTWYELVENPYELTPEQAQQQALETIQSRFAAEDPEREVLAQEVECQTEQDHVTVTVRYTCREDIAVEDPILWDITTAPEQGEE